MTKKGKEIRTNFEVALNINKSKKFAETITTFRETNLRY